MFGLVYSLHTQRSMGVACLTINVRNYGDVVNALSEIFKKVAFTNNVDPDETPQPPGVCLLPC